MDKREKIINTLSRHLRDCKELTAGYKRRAIEAEVLQRALILAAQNRQSEMCNATRWQLAHLILGRTYAGDLKQLQTTGKAQPQQYYGVQFQFRRDLEISRVLTFLGIGHTVANAAANGSALRQEIILQEIW